MDYMWVIEAKYDDEDWYPTDKQFGIREWAREEMRVLQDLSDEGYLKAIKYRVAKYVREKVD